MQVHSFGRTNSRDDAMNDATVVYTAGVFDMFHVGHLNILKRAKGLGDRLIVGVCTDELVSTYKSAPPMMRYEDRAEIVSAIRFVDLCIPQLDRDKLDAWRRLKFDILAVGDDWYGKQDYVTYEEQLKQVGVKVVYLPYTGSVSSTKLRERIETNGK